jgi:hypothetical protein
MPIRRVIVALVTGVGVPAACLPAVANAAPAPHTNVGTASAAVKTVTAPPQHSTNVATLATKSVSKDAAIRAFWTPARVKEALASDPRAVRSMLADKDTNSKVKNFLEKVLVQEQQNHDGTRRYGCPKQQD